jgi:hypothetical protein
VHLNYIQSYELREVVGWSYLQTCHGSQSHIPGKHIDAPNFETANALCKVTSLITKLTDAIGSVEQHATAAEHPAYLAKNEHQTTQRRPTDGVVGGADGPTEVVSVG